MTNLLPHPAIIAALANLAVTALFQFRPFTTRARSFDLIGIIPRWKFFVPHPDRIDVGLELRCGSHDGDLGAWTPVRIYPPRHVLTWLWFPEQHRAIMVLLSAHRTALRALRQGESDEGATETLAYQTLVRHMRQAEQAQRSDLFQFMLVRLNSAAADRTLFTSRWHRL